MDRLTEAVLAVLRSARDDSDPAGSSLQDRARLSRPRRRKRSGALGHFRSGTHSRCEARHCSRLPSPTGAWRARSPPGKIVRIVHWRSRLARDRLAPEGFLVPCQPVLSAAVPTGPKWVHEVKWDQYRMIVCKEVGSLRVWSRNAKVCTPALPAIVEAVRELPSRPSFLDGEVAACSDPSRGRWSGLRELRVRT